jgi:hypothetical protein
VSVVLGAAPAYVLLSIAYEPLFVAALAAALLAWMLVETHLAAACCPVRVPPRPLAAGTRGHRGLSRVQGQQTRGVGCGAAHASRQESAEFVERGFRGSSRLAQQVVLP